MFLTDVRNKKSRDNKGESSLKNQLCLKGDKSNAVANKKEVTKTPKNYPQLSLERTIVFSAKTGITNVSIKVRRK